MTSDTQRADVSGRLLFLHAQTSLHPGSGTAVGVVDLPIQRERHTAWPLIPGSTLKGVLRDRCRQQVAGSSSDADADPYLSAVFGPPQADASKHAGALSVTDARVLAFPVRSLSGVFAWVTCEAALQRLTRDLRIAGAPPLPTPLPQVGESQAACIAKSPLLVNADRMILEEFEFTRCTDLGQLGTWLAEVFATDDLTRARLQTHLVVLHDNDFSHFVKHATEVMARVALDYARKTVRNGALFYQEFLPPETLLYSVMLTTSSRGDATTMSGADVLAYLKERLATSGWLQIGGNETTGKGFCTTRIWPTKE